MAAPPNGRLDSWKEIADYLRKDASTVMRWAKERGLPVHHVPGGTRTSVFAFKEEIDAWLLSTGTRDSGLGIGEAKSVTGSSGLGVGTGNRSTSRRVEESNVAAAGGQQPGPRHSSLATRHYALALAALAAIVGFTYYMARPLPVPRLVGYTQITHDGRRKEGNLVTDGAKLYFVETFPTGKAIVQVPTSGGETQRLSAFFKSPGIEDLSLSRGEMLVSDPVGTASLRPALWALSLSSGQPRRVGDVFADAAGWSPDGSTIAYAAGPHLYLSGSDGREAHQIADAAGNIGCIHWSSDGKRLLLSVSRTGTGVASIWEVKLDGSDLHALFTQFKPTDSLGGGSWTSDGKYFLFTLGTEGEDQLWTLPEVPAALGLRGGEPVQLTTGPLRVGLVVPSHDGRRVFISGFTVRNELLRFDKVSEEFVPYLDGVSGDELNFSQDGQWVAYTDATDGNLWRRRADGSQGLQLTFPPLRVELPRWSPDGKQIAFMGRRRPDDLWQVFLISAQGGEYRPVLSMPYPQGAPTWSADGTQLAFGELLPGRGRTPATLAIHVVNLRTHEATTLPGSNGLWTARWSPDGQHMAALTADSRTLMVYDFHREVWEKVFTAGSISDLNWSRKSDGIYIEDLLAPNGPAILFVRLRDRHVEEVANPKREPPIYSPWFGLAPDDSPMVSNAVGTSEIYALDWEAP